jgi:tyrosine-protein phosphatase YwqE
MRESAWKALNEAFNRKTHATDPMYHNQVEFVRELLERVERMLQHEGLDAEVIDRVMEGLVYGTLPYASDAVLRDFQEQRMRDVFRYATRPTVVSPLGFPDR